VINSGIYKIECLPSKKIYIGSSENLSLRKHDHFRFLRSKKHINPKLQSAFSKYGEENFKFEILLYCEPKDCIFYEQIFIDKLSPVFNINLVAGKPPSQKGKKFTRSSIQIENYKKASLKRESERRKKIMQSEMWIYEGINSSGLSVRKFCELNNLTKNRTAINKRYRQYLNGIEEAAKIS